MSENPRGWTPRIIEGGKKDSVKPEGAERKGAKPNSVTDPFLSLDGSPADTVYFVMNSERTMQAAKRGEEIFEYILAHSNLKEDRGNAGSAAGRAASFSFDSLINHLLNSTEKDWEASPAFYKAVVEEAAQRLRLARGVIM